MTPFEDDAPEIEQTEHEKASNLSPRGDIDDPKGVTGDLKGVKNDAQYPYYTLKNPVDESLSRPPDKLNDESSNVVALGNRCRLSEKNNIGTIQNKNKSTHQAERRLAEKIGGYEALLSIPTEEAIRLTRLERQGRLKPGDLENAQRGSRLPDDWQIPDDWIDWARKELREHDVALDLTREASRFRDYWTAQTGQRGVKANWFATWRNWVRNGVDRITPTNESPKQAGLMGPG